MTSEKTTPPIVRTLMQGVIDYAGLFPPSRLAMGDAVSNHARALRSEHADFLGRFVCPASRLEELSRDGAVLMPGTYATSGYREHADHTEPWRVSAVVTGELGEQLERIYAFNERHDDESNGRAMVDTIEMRVREPAEIDAALTVLPEMIGAAFEIPHDTVVEGDPRGLVAALAGSGTLAKIRCGGVEPSMIPPAASVARFILACAGAGVAFKCTAGLHHPIRAEHALTYEDDAPRAVMHGFVNVLVAACAAQDRDGPGGALLTRILDETDPGAFAFRDDSISWRDAEGDLGIEIDEPLLAHTRESFCTSIGSCSIDEPIEDLGSLGLL